MRLDTASACYGGIHPALDRPSDVIWTDPKTMLEIVKACGPVDCWALTPASLNDVMVMGKRVRVVQEGWR